MGSVSHVADYIVIPGTDAKFSIQVHSGRSFSFRIPPHAVLTERAVLAFVADPPGDADDVEYEVQINDQRILSGSFTGGVRRSLMETFSGNLLREGDNSIEFRVTSGSSSSIAAGPALRVRFSDAVLWFQRKVAEAPV